MSNILTRDPDWSIKSGHSSANLLEKKIIRISDEPEMLTVNIYCVKHPKTTKGVGNLEQVNVETCWGGWGGSNACFVEDQIPSDSWLLQPRGSFLKAMLDGDSHSLNPPSLLSHIQILKLTCLTLSVVDKVSSPKNHRFDYEKRCVHRYTFIYIPDHECPMLKW